MIIILSLGLSVLGIFVGSVLLNQKLDVFRYSSIIEDSQKSSFAGNMILMIILPSIFITIVCGIADMAGNIYLINNAVWIIVGYWLTRVIIILLLNRSQFINWGFNCVVAIISILVGFLIWRYFILWMVNNNMPVIIERREIYKYLWLAVIGLIGKFIWELTKSLCNGQKIYPDEIKKEKIRQIYKKLNEQFHTVVTDCLKSIKQDEKTKVLEIYVYSLMIYENYNRPLIVRFLERMLLRLRLKHVVSQGIMQYPSSNIITDEESIRLRTKEIILKWDFKDICCDADISKSINARSDYYSNIMYIADTISSEYGTRDYYDLKENVKLELEQQPECDAVIEEKPIGTIESAIMMFRDGKYEDCIRFLKYIEHVGGEPISDNQEPLLLTYIVLLKAYEATENTEQVTVYNQKINALLETQL